MADPASVSTSLFSEQARLLILVGGCAALWSVESIVPLYERRGERLRHAAPNVALTVILVLTNLALSLGVAAVSTNAVSQRIGLFFVAGLPAWAEVVLGVVALDFFAYLAHVAMHRSRVGWRFHRVHHSDEAVDVTTAFRQHPGETVWRVVCYVPAIVLLGLPMGTVAVYLTISAVNAQLEHANVRLPERLDRLLRLVLVTPNMHKVHHSCRQAETDSNYSNIFSVWDRLFGTYTRRVDLRALRYGLDGLDARTTRRLGGLLALPFARRGRARE